MLAVATSEALIGPVKALYDRPRPTADLTTASGAAFPSGHAVAAAVTAVGLVLVLLRPGHHRWVWEHRAAYYASLVALRRCYLADHLLSDGRWSPQIWPRHRLASVAGRSARPTGGPTRRGQP